ncbi:protein phosphatase 1 regulatory subunit 27-like [Tubulanus polymorphus]|uniref:protein phosphatase 1 regulatory subunit 27-like n=1 Tax=Tubulanus polymorphus TaxID=672921 RepID=UPI003DA59D2C
MAAASDQQQQSLILADLQQQLRTARAPVTLSTLAQIGDEKLVEKFLTENINIKGNGPHALQSQLYLASFWGFKDIVKSLINLGADVNKQNNGSGWTPLHAATFQECGPVVMLLIQNGADPEIPDELGRTPKDFASASEKIWMHFAALRLKRTSKIQLVHLGVLRQGASLDSRPSSRIASANLNNFGIAFESSSLQNECLTSSAAAVNGDVLADDQNRQQQQKQTTPESQQPNFSLWK